jgi:hypothetical protein
MLHGLNTTSEQVMTVRTAASAYINLGSDDRFKRVKGDIDYGSAPQPITNFTINLGQAVNIAQPRRFAATQVYFPMYLPNLTPENNALRIFNQTDSTDTILNIQDATNPDYTKIYTGTQLASLITAVLVAAPAPLGLGTLVVTFDVTTSAFSIASTGNTVEFAVLPAGPNDLRRVLGWNTAAFFQPTPATPTVKYSWLGGYTTVNQTNIIDICSRRLTQHQGIPDTDTNKTANSVVVRLYIPPMNGQASLILFEPQVPKYIKANPDMFLPDIDISLIDEDGNPPYFPPTGGAEFTMTIFISES